MQIKSFLCLEQPNVFIDQNLHPWLMLTSNNFNILELMNMTLFYGAQTSLWIHFTRLDIHQFEANPPF
jgi:hypothetical protein